jgi:hypothetical protein
MLLPLCLLSKNIIIKIYETIILPVVLYGCETWSVMLKDEHRFEVVWDLGAEYLDLRGMTWKDAGECFMVRRSIIYALHKILLG